MPTIPERDIHPDVLREMLSRGKLGPPVKLGEDEPAAEDSPLCTPGVALVEGKLIATIPVKTASEINGREWRRRSQRTKEARLAVSRTLGPHLDLLAPFALAYHDGKALRIVFTRLGGRRMDRMANLGSALKGVEDALALMLGADDGDPRWVASCEQEPGGVLGIGVRMEIEVYR